MKNLLLILIFLISIGCNHPKEKHPTKQDYIIALLAINYNFTDSCLQSYGYLNQTLFQSYLSNQFNSYSPSCENVIIGDSTMDLARQTTFYDSSKTLNYAVSGNTACDFLYQMESIRCTPKNVIIATSDGNGILRGVSSQISIDTITKVINRSKTKWNPTNIIVIGIHPILIQSANLSKNEVNIGVSKIDKICYIDPLPVFGVGPNDSPSTEFMIDNIHYKEPIYSRFKSQIFNQCNINL